MADDDLPPEIHSRVMAATAHASVRSITHGEASDPELPHGQWTVHALAGDRLVEMVVALRADGSVFEETRTFLIDQILKVFDDADGATVELQGPSGPESMRVPEEIRRVLPQPDEEGLERAVKGVGQVMAGRLKELAGELLDDPELKDAGTAQRLEGEARRSGIETAERLEE